MILARKFKILEDPGGSLQILARIFKDPDEDPHKDPHQDPQRFLKILERFSPGSTRSVFEIIQHAMTCLRMR